MREHDGVDRAGAGRGGAFERNAIVFQQAVEHAPGEGAVTAAALETEVNGLGPGRRWLGTGCFNSLVHEIAF